jgi:hypothetical protein
MPTVEKLRSLPQKARHSEQREEALYFAWSVYAASGKIQRFFGFASE